MDKPPRVPVVLIESPVQPSDVDLPDTQPIDISHLLGQVQ